MKLILTPVIREKHEFDFYQGLANREKRGKGDKKKKVPLGFECESY